MPLYEYACPSCEADFELLVRSSETPTCPQCGGQHLQKLLSVPAAHTPGGSRELPMSSPAPISGGCGRPQCATRCQGM